MGLLDLLNPFDAAMQTLARRDVMPTSLNTAQLRKLGAAFHAGNFVSAQHTITGPLTDLFDGVKSILNPTTEQRPDRVTPENPQGNVTTGMNPADARLAVKQSLRAAGYQPDPDKRGTLMDLSSDPRINLQIKTNVERHQGDGFAIQSNDPAVLEAFPCWEFYRLEDRNKTRDWPTRWRTAAALVGDTDAIRVLDETERMVARIDSPIWQALGDGEGGYDDVLHRDRPPFAYNSGMWTRIISMKESLALGFVFETPVASSDIISQLLEEVA